MEHLSEQTRQRIASSGYTIFQKIRYVYTEYAYHKLLDSRWNIPETLNEIIVKGEQSSHVTWSHVTMGKLNEILPKLFAAKTDGDWFQFQLHLRSVLRLMTGKQHHKSKPPLEDTTPMEMVFSTLAMRTSS